MLPSNTNTNTNMNMNMNTFTQNMNISPDAEVARRPVRRCSNCHQPGHNRNNRNCPMYAQTQVPTQPRIVQHHYTPLFQTHNQNHIVQRCKIICSIIAIIKDTIYDQLCRLMVHGQSIQNVLNNRNIFLLTSFSQTLKGIISEIVSIGTVNRQYFYMDRIQTIEILLKPIIDTEYTQIIEHKIVSLNRPDIYSHYISLKTIKIILPINIFNISINISDSIDSSAYDCPICLNIKDPDTKCTTNCAHNFCNTCITSHIKYAHRNNDYQNNVYCPLCREHIKSISVSSYDTVKL